MARVFHKSILNNFVHFGGHKVRWEPVGIGTDGVLTLDDVRDAALIAELDRLADAKRKGVRRISVEIRDNLKKNIRTAKVMELGPNVRVFNPQKLLPKKSLDSSGQGVPVAAGNVPPAPVFTQTTTPPPPEPPPSPASSAAPITPKPPAKPRTMKKSQLKKLEEQQPAA